MLPLTLGAVQHTDSDTATLLGERALLRKLLDLEGKEEIQPLLNDALALIIEVAGARRGYLEVCDENGDASQRFWIEHGCTDADVEEIRRAFSSGIVAEAIATGEVIVTVSALEDPRFGRRESVRLNRIEAALCAPIGSDPPFGVLYLQDRVLPGGFSEEARDYAQLFARHVATLADRLLVRRRFRDESDPTLPFRRKLRLDGLVGRSVALGEVFSHISLVAPLDVSVLLTGASGTGKTAVARVIHANGPRSARPFIELNCAAFPESLLESELFGALPGAHSTANRKVEGKVAAAEGGTLFLDEVGELSPAGQAKLLQLLQSKEYYPLGSPRAQKADVRIVAATNVDLRSKVAAREFREDLFYRLQVLPIAIPSLGERREDLPELCAVFATSVCEMHHLPKLSLSRRALRAVTSREWPGNVRELHHAIQAGAIRAAGAGASEIDAPHIFPAEPSASRPEQPLTFQEATRRYQAELVQRELDETNWNVTETAARLDLARSHVYSLIRSFGLKRAEH